MLKVVGYDTVSMATSRGQLTLVNLAGSERIPHREASGIRLVEAAAINKSLSACKCDCVVWLHRNCILVGVVAVILVGMVSCMVMWFVSVHYVGVACCGYSYLCVMVLSTFLTVTPNSPTSSSCALEETRIRR